MKSRVSWQKIEAGRYWRCVDAKGRVLGCVRFAFDTWDAIIVTGKKWPESDRCVQAGVPFWQARRAVEAAVEMRK